MAKTPGLPAGFSLRPAAVADCLEIARLYQVSAEGVADYIWAGLAGPGENLIEVGRRRYARDDCPFSYRNCLLVTAGEAIAGFLVAFPSESDGVLPEDPVLVPYARLDAPGSYYICGMALHPPYRGLGIGSELLRLAHARAAALSHRETSLIVFDSNTGARRLYERHGYVEVKREPIVPHPLIRGSGDAVLLVRPLAA